MTSTCRFAGVAVLVGFVAAGCPARGPSLPGPITTTTTVVGATTTLLATNTTTTLSAGVVVSDMLNPQVSQETLSTTICLAGYTRRIRPPTSFTDMLKMHQIVTYGYADRSVADYEEDHVIALGLGGAPAAPANLWPQPRSSSNGDDRLEDDLHNQVCAGRLDLAEAQAHLLAAKAAHGYRREASVA